MKDLLFFSALKNQWEDLKPASCGPICIYLTAGQLYDLIKTNKKTKPQTNKEAFSSKLL